MASLCLLHGISYSTMCSAREAPISTVRQSSLIILVQKFNSDFFYVSLSPQEWSHGLSTLSMAFSTSILSFCLPSQLLPSLSSVLVSLLTFVTIIIMDDENFAFFSFRSSLMLWSSVSVVAAIGFRPSTTHCRCTA